MELLPTPRTITEGNGVFRFDEQTPIILVHTPPGAFIAAGILRDEIKAATGLPLAILRGKGFPGAIVLRLYREDALSEGAAYTLAVTRDGVTVCAASEEALQWGAMTLAQLVRLHGRYCPACTSRTRRSLRGAGIIRTVPGAASRPWSS